MTARRREYIFFPLIQDTPRELPAEYLIFNSDPDRPVHIVGFFAPLDTGEFIVKAVRDRTDLHIVDYHFLTVVEKFADGGDDCRRTGPERFVEFAVPVSLDDLVDREVTLFNGDAPFFEKADATKSLRV